MKLLAFSPAAIFLLLRSGLASPTPVIDDTVSASKALEDRQASLLVVTLGSYGTSYITGRYIQAALDRARFGPGLNQTAGSYCFTSGSWSPNGSVRKLATAACKNLIPRALDFQKYGDPKKTNPNVVYYTNLDGSPLINSEGYSQSITFGMLDQNGKRGADCYTQSACELAITSLLNDCHGDNDDTRGGVHACGDDGVAAYSIDPTCVDSVDKKCGAHI